MSGVGPRRTRRDVEHGQTAGGWSRASASRAREDLPAVESGVDPLAPDATRALRALVDEYRDRCLWFLRRDYYPATAEEARRVLDAIDRHGDREAFQRTAEIRRWLSPPSSATSADS